MPQHPDPTAGWVIGSYLVLHSVFLTCVGLVAWLASSWADFFQLVFIQTPWENILDKDKFSLFRTMLVSACAAGVGGAVFMIREFYIKFSYGRPNNGHIEFLKLREIPRYTLLPFSAVFLGPIALGLAKAGAITFSGVSGEAQIPDFTLVALSFLLGFSFHDTLKGLSDLSKKLWGQQNSEA